MRGKIDYYELGTPLSTDYFCRYSHGEIYGLNHDPERLLPQTCLYNCSPQGTVLYTRANSKAAGLRICATRMAA